MGWTPPYLQPHHRQVWSHEDEEEAVSSGPAQWQGWGRPPTCAAIFHRLPLAGVGGHPARAPSSLHPPRHPLSPSPAPTSGGHLSCGQWPGATCWNSACGVTEPGLRPSEGSKKGRSPSGL
ncbi:unnamed protein product [Rangifer tarandus platyrhynchus]|uniref:Uncharacterized protein n=1 Tax=Rangifer tarandus platyrhynchus TaxID=3082113 RepID=A0AC59ZWK4_RANTA